MTLAMADSGAYTLRHTRADLFNAQLKVERCWLMTQLNSISSFPLCIVVELFIGELV